MVTEDALLELLSDGCFHSGTELGHKLDISRTAVWKHIKALESAYGLDVQAVQGKGYRLPVRLDLLDPSHIKKALSAQAGALLSELEVKTVVDSTSHYLMQQPSVLPGYAHVVLAERQTAGRGRRGRNWISPFAQNIYLSLLWSFDNSLMNLSGLSLAVGVSVVDALTQSGVSGLMLKWPNDIYYQGRKLGGILLELKGEAGGPCSVVVGLGLNVSMSRQAGADIDQAWTDLASISRQSLSRNELVSALLNTLLPAMQLYASQGLTPFISRWQEHDMLKDKPVALLLPQQQRLGIARGIDEQGALLFESNGQLETLYAGEVSLRLSSD